MDSSCAERIFVLTRDVRGFGLETSGEKPATISCVLKGSVAEQSGLRVGDELIRINGDAVTHCSAEKVNGIIKKCGKHMQLTIRRPGNTADQDTSIIPNSVASGRSGNDANLQNTNSNSTSVSVPGKHSAMNRTRLSFDAALHDSLSSIKRSIFSQKPKSSSALMPSQQDLEDASTGKSKRGKHKADITRSEARTTRKQSSGLELADSIPPASETSNKTEVQLIEQIADSADVLTTQVIIEEEPAVDLVQLEPQEIADEITRATATVPFLGSNDQQSKRTMSLANLQLRDQDELEQIEWLSKRISHSEEDVRRSYRGKPASQMRFQKSPTKDSSQTSAVRAEAAAEPPENEIDGATDQPEVPATAITTNTSATQSSRAASRKDAEISRSLAQRSSLRNELRYHAVNLRRNSADVSQSATAMSLSMMTPALLSLEEESFDARSRKQQSEQPGSNSSSSSSSGRRLFGKEKRKTVVYYAKEDGSSEPDVEKDAVPRRTEQEASVNSVAASESAALTFPSHFEARLDDPDFNFALPALESLSHRLVHETLSPHEREAQKVLIELVHTERVHAHYLRVISSVFYSDWPSSLTDLRDLLIPGLPQLAAAHAELLDQMVRCALFFESSDDARSFGAFDVCRVARALGDALSDAQFAERVARFCERQNEAFSRVSDARLNDRRFAAFVQRGESNALCRRMRLNDLALIEMQRVTKYPLLIEKLVHCCEKAARSSSDICAFESRFSFHSADTSKTTTAMKPTPGVREQLECTLAASRKLLDLVNTRVREYENAMRWRSLVAQVDRVSFSDVCQSYLENRRLQSRLSKSQSKKTSFFGSKHKNREEEHAEQFETALIDGLRRGLDTSQLIHSSDRLVWQLGQQRQVTTIATLIRHDDSSLESKFRSRSRFSYFLLLFEPFSSMQTSQVNMPAQKLVLRAHNMALYAQQSSVSSKNAANNAAFAPPLLLPVIRIDERTLIRPDAADKRAFFVVSNTQTQIHTFVAASADERRAWLANLADSVTACSLTQTSPAGTSVNIRTAQPLPTLLAERAATQLHDDSEADKQQDAKGSEGADTVDTNKAQAASAEQTLTDVLQNCLEEQQAASSWNSTQSPEILLSSSAGCEENSAASAGADALDDGLEGDSDVLAAAHLQLAAALAAQNEVIASALDQKNRLIERLLPQPSAADANCDCLTGTDQNNEDDITKLSQYIRSLSLYSDTLVRNLMMGTSRQVQNSAGENDGENQSNINNAALLDEAALAGVRDVLQRFVDHYRTEA